MLLQHKKCSMQFRVQRCVHIAYKALVLVYMQYIPVLEDWCLHHFSTVVAQLQYIPYCKQSSGLRDLSA